MFGAKAGSGKRREGWFALIYGAWISLAETFEIVFLGQRNRAIDWRVDGAPECLVRVERKDSAFTSVASLFNCIPDVVGAPWALSAINPRGIAVVNYVEAAFNQPQTGVWG